MPNEKQESVRAVLNPLRQLVKALRVASRSLEKAHGLSSAQLFVLEQLRGSDGISLNEVAQRTLTHQSSVSVVVKKLAEQGLVSRKSAKDDSRRLEIFLTPSGERTLAHTPNSIQAQLITALARMGASERKLLGKLLNQMVMEAGLHSTQPPQLFFEDVPRSGKSQSITKPPARSKL
jgi:DNA-binding MarR family transcriptional regulator